MIKKTALIINLPENGAPSEPPASVIDNTCSSIQKKRKSKSKNAGSNKKTKKNLTFSSLIKVDDWDKLEENLEVAVEFDEPGRRIKNRVKGYNFSGCVKLRGFNETKSTKKAKMKKFNFDDFLQSKDSFIPFAEDFKSEEAKLPVEDTNGGKRAISKNRLKGESKPAGEVHDGVRRRFGSFVNQKRKEKTFPYFRKTGKKEGHNLQQESRLSFPDLLNCPPASRNLQQRF